MELDIVVLAAEATAQADVVNLKHVSTTTFDTGSDLRLVDATTFSLRGDPYLLGYFGGQDVAPVYKVRASGAEVTVESKAHMELGANWNIIESFVIGNSPHLLTYQQDKGIFKFYPVMSDLTCAAPYRFFRNHDPGVSAGFTTVKLFTAQGEVVYLGYNARTGDVALYTLSVTATSPAGLPPLSSLCVWFHKWAPNWTRFAFFQWGCENFFLKTNTTPDKPNVNIDHVLDTLANGTVEVGSYLNLAKAQQLSIVEPFTLDGGDPYFLTYAPDGHATLNRFHGDAQGWTTVCELDTVAGASQIVPVKDGGRQLFACFVPK